MSERRWVKVSSMWLGGPLSWLEKLCLSSFAAKGYEVKLYSYDKLDVPSGIELADARQILPQDEVFRNPPPSKSYAGFSNVFRYELLSKRPQEVWIDTDVLAGNTWLPDSEFLLGYESKYFINGAVLRCPPDDQLLRDLLDHAKSIDKKTFKWGDLGPKLITKRVSELEMLNVVSAKTEFYPVTSLDVWKLFSPKHRVQIEESVRHSSAIHVWNEAFGLSKNEIKAFAPHPDSFIGRRLASSSTQLASGTQLLPSNVLNGWALRSSIQKVRNGLGRLVRA